MRVRVERQKERIPVKAKRVEMKGGRTTDGGAAAAVSSENV